MTLMEAGVVMEEEIKDCEIQRLTSTFSSERELTQEMTMIKNVQMKKKVDYLKGGGSWSKGSEDDVDLTRALHQACRDGCVNRVNELLCTDKPENRNTRLVDRRDELGRSAIHF